VDRKGRIPDRPAHGVEHRPVAEEEGHVLLFEPAATLNTGSVQNDLMVDALKRI
jgi:hypothetical protein